MMPLTRLRLRFRSHLRLGLAGRFAVAALVLLGAGAGVGAGQGTGLGARVRHRRKRRGALPQSKRHRAPGRCSAPTPAPPCSWSWKRRRFSTPRTPDRPYPPASLSKLATVYATFRALEKEGYSGDDTFSVSEKAWRTGGSKMFVEVGKRVRIDDLLRGVIVSPPATTPLSFSPRGWGGTKPSSRKASTDSVPRSDCATRASPTPPACRTPRTG